MIWRLGAEPTERAVTIPSVTFVRVVVPGTMQGGWPFICHGPDAVPCQGVASCSCKLSLGPFAGWKSSKMPASLVALPTEISEPLADVGEALLSGRAYPTTPPTTTITAPPSSLRPPSIHSRSPHP